MSDDASIRLATPGDLDRLHPMWEALYRHQEAHGMRLRLPGAAFDHWKRSMAPHLGRFAVVVIAERGTIPTGFVAGRVRTLPPYFGSAVVGTVSEVFVAETERGGRVGERMLTAALEWFTAQGIARVEAQVVSHNSDALRFYRRLGWVEELSQVVWERSAPDERNR